MKLPQSQLEAVIWDLDGVIANTGPFHFQAWQALAAEAGLSFTEEDFRAAFGMRNSEILLRLFGESRVAEAGEELSQRKEALYRGIIRGKVKSLPGVLRLLDSLKRAGIKMALASSTPLENIGLILRELKIAEFLSAIVADKDVAQGKPHPDCFLLAAKRLSLPPERCLVVEDAVVGIQASHRAGMKCLAVANSHPRESLAEADLVVDSLEEVSLADMQRLFAEGNTVVDKYASRRFDTQTEEAIDVAVLEAIPFQYPGSNTEVVYETDEFTSVCPWTGLPDFAHLLVRYVPGRQLVELKSLKYYLTSYRQVGILQEHAVNRILRDLVALVKPLSMTVEASFGERGGIKTKAVARYPASGERS